MVDLEPVSALTSVPGAGEPRLSQQSSLQGWWCGPFSAPVVEVAAGSVSGDYFDVGVTQNRLEGLLSDPDSGVEYHPRLPVRGCRLFGVDDDGHLPFRRVIGDEGFHQSGRPTPPGITLDIIGQRISSLGRESCRPWLPVYRRGRTNPSTTTHRNWVASPETGPQRYGFRCRR